MDRTQTERTTAVIVAAGNGRRMNSTVKKQYMEIAGHPVLYYTIKAFEESNVDDIIIVTGADETEYVQNDIVDRYDFKKVSVVCIGGRERFDSVFRGIDHISGKCGYVLIHDGVRMMVTPGLINRCIDAVRRSGACVAGVKVKDTIKECSIIQTGDDRSQMSVTIENTPERSKLYQIQTPQCFELSLIKNAFEKLYSLPEEKRPAITDDSMLVETFADHKVEVVEGDYLNIKITTPEDLELAQFWMNKYGTVK